MPPAENVDYASFRYSRGDSSRSLRDSRQRAGSADSRYPVPGAVRRARDRGDTHTNSGLKSACRSSSSPSGGRRMPWRPYSAQAVRPWRRRYTFIKALLSAQ